MKISKKLLLTQVAQAIALIASSAAFADSKPTGISNYIASGNSVLAPMVSDGVSGFGVNNELFLLTQKQKGFLKDDVVYVNGKLNIAANGYIISPKNGRTNASAVLNPGLDLAFTTTKGWFTAFAELSTNSSANAFLSWASTKDNTNNPAVGLGIFDVNNNSVYDPNQAGIGLLQAYLMMGDLNKAPVYFLAGRKYVDFGSFANQSGTWKPLTNVFNQNIQSQLSLGFYQSGIHGAVTVYKSPWTTSAKAGTNSSYKNNQLSTVAASLSYGTKINRFEFLTGLSFTSNLNPNVTVYGGGASNSFNDNAQNRVDGGIIFAEVNFKPITVTGSYAGAMKTVSNNQGKPDAWDVGVKFDFNLMKRANWLSGNFSHFNSKFNGNKISQWLFGWNVAITNNINTTLQYGHQKVKTENTKYNFIAINASVYF